MDFYVYGIPAPVTVHYGIEVRVFHRNEIVDIYSPTSGNLILMKETNIFFAQAALMVIDHGPRWSSFLIAWSSMLTVWYIQIDGKLSPPFMVFPAETIGWDTPELDGAMNDLEMWFKSARVPSEIYELLRTFPKLIWLLDMPDKMRLAPDLLLKWPRLIHHIPEFATLPTVFVEALKTWPEALTAAKMGYPTQSVVDASRVMYKSPMFLPNVALPVLNHPDVVLASFRYGRSLTHFTKDQVIQVMMIFIEWWHDGYLMNLMTSIALCRKPRHIRQRVNQFHTVLPMKDMTKILTNMVRCVDTNRHVKSELVEKSCQWATLLKQLDEIRWTQTEIEYLIADKCFMHAARLTFLKSTNKTLLRRLRLHPYAFLENLI